MFEDTVATLYKLFDEKNLAILDEEEKDALPAKHTVHLRYKLFQVSYNIIKFSEGVKIIRGRAGIYSTNGRVILTKNIEPGMAIGKFIAEIVLLLSFPGCLFVDLHGFVIDSDDKPVFQYGSQNSALTLQNEENHIFLDSPKEKEKTYTYFENMSNDEIGKKWFDRHNQVSNLLTSGFRLGNIVSVVMFYEPETQHVDKIFNLE